MTTRVLVVGGAGYVGCVLVPKLLADGYDVGVFDLMLYGAEGLPAHPCLDVIEGDPKLRMVSAGAVAQPV